MMRDSLPQKIFYVYTYFDPIRQEYFYVGKGKGYRIQKRKNLQVVNRINWIKNQGQDPIVSKYAQNLDEPDAFTIEAFLIEQIGRKNIGSGPLLNWVDGGPQGTNDGFLGKKHSKETLQKRSTAWITPELKAHRKLLSSKKWMIIFPDGSQKEIFNLKKFAEENHISRQHLGRGKSQGFKAYQLKTEKT